MLVGPASHGALSRYLQKETASFLRTVRSIPSRTASTRCRLRPTGRAFKLINYSARNSAERNYILVALCEARSVAVSSKRRPWERVHPLRFYVGSENRSREKLRRGRERDDGVISVHVVSRCFTRRRVHLRSMHYE